MAHWIGDKVTLKAGPQTGYEQAGSAEGNHDAEADNESLRLEYRESFITEYDGINVFRQQGCYEHAKQVHKWSFYEYKMIINGECWNIVINDDMQNPPDWSYPGSSSSKLSHDFCHIDIEASDDEYTNFYFAEMGGRQIWPFYATESFPEDLWIWISPRRFAITTNHQHSAKLNHFYADRMHDHHILANRTPCWYFTDLTNTQGKVKDKVIALSEDNRCGSAAHETFLTGFEHKSAMTPGQRKEELLHGKRKYSDPSGQASTQQFDPSGNYSARDMHKLNATFADQPDPKPAPPVPTHTTSKVTMWRHGEVPPLGPTTEGRARAIKQLAYARTLLTAVMEAATQMEEVVGNLVQIENEYEQAKEEVPEQAAASEPRTEPAAEGSHC